MQTKRKCERCNTLNDSGQTYCVNCGKYLRGKIVNKEAKFTIWGIDDSPAIDVGNKDIDSHAIVVCPECSSKCPVENGVLPLSCPACGYFFQAGVDKVINASGAKKEAKIVKTNLPCNNSSENKPIANGPLRKVERDATSLRLTAISSSNMLPEIMREAGNIIGKDGTVFKAIRTSQQLTIWHTAAGWYVRAIAGTPLYNGVPMNQGIQMKLSDGDFLMLEKEQFRVEIF